METDLGEYILQLAHEAPSHIVAPVVHKNKEEISDLFEEKHQLPRKTESPNCAARRAKCCARHS